MESPAASDHTPEKEVVHDSLFDEFPAAAHDKALVRKIDMKVLPMLFIIYVAAFLDRVNISNALTMDLPKDLGLTGNQPNVALAIFFVPYVLFEIPSNYALKKLKPHVWLSACILGFGIFMLAQGFVKNYGALIATRFLLGLAEAGIFPGSFYLISFWYKREEAQKRFTFYWCSVLVASAFGGLLAGGIANMDGIGGLNNWRWIFILEGIGTIIVGVVAYFAVADFPEQARWLTEDERKWIAHKTGRDTGREETIKLKDVASFFKDYKNIIAGVLYFTMTVPVYSFAFFGPTIIKTSLHYSTVQTQLHTVPPIAAALALAIILAVASDRTNHRSAYIGFCYLVIIAGLAMLYAIHDNFHAQYAGIHLVAMGAFAGGPIVVCWYVMNLQGHAQRAIGTAWMIGFGNTGGVVAIFAFLSKDAPKYQKGYTAIIAVTCVGTAATIVYALSILRLNRKREAGSSWRYSL